MTTDKINARNTAQYNKVHICCNIEGYYFHSTLKTEAEVFNNAKNEYLKHVKNYLLTLEAMDLKTYTSTMKAQRLY